MSASPFTVVRHRGEVLVFTGRQVEQARARAAKLALAPIFNEGSDALLDVAQVCERAKFSKAWLYDLRARSKFPPPDSRAAPGRRGKVFWRESTVARWLRDRATQQQAECP